MIKTGIQRATEEAPSEHGEGVVSGWHGSNYVLPQQCPFQNVKIQCFDWVSLCQAELSGRGQRSEKSLAHRGAVPARASLKTTTHCPSSILQAMDLDVPVLARNIPGNAAVVQHGVTGLLFSDPQVWGRRSLLPLVRMVFVCVSLNVLHVFISSWRPCCDGGSPVQCGDHVGAPGHPSRKTWGLLGNRRPEGLSWSCRQCSV